jgi:hypothetical protein
VVTLWSIGETDFRHRAARYFAECPGFSGDRHTAHSLYASNAVSPTDYTLALPFDPKFAAGRRPASFRGHRSNDCK